VEHHEGVWVVAPPRAPSPPTHTRSAVCVSFSVATAAVPIAAWTPTSRQTPLVSAVPHSPGSLPVPFLSLLRVPVGSPPHRLPPRPLLLAATPLVTQTCVRDDSTGLYWSSVCPPPPARPATLPPATSVLLGANHPLAATALQSLVSVSFHTPVMSDGVHGWAFVGVGRQGQRSRARRPGGWGYVRSCCVPHHHPLPK
jgi:hypothetical protein